MTLREVLHAHIPTLGRESSFRDAVDKMDVYQFPALVVVDDDRKPTHVLTEGDLCRAVGDQGGALVLSGEPAVRFATPDPVCEGPTTEISDALHLMLSRGISLLPVVQDDRLLGVVLRVDLLQALLMDAAAAS
ncbi:MAG: CBS domain-containing protein [Fimbriimonadaceae bacterium]|nr:CBS domain-containing protein [Fimbriimonadaceae bacterium]